MRRCSAADGQKTTPEGEAKRNLPTGLLLGRCSGTHALYRMVRLCFQVVAVKGKSGRASVEEIDRVHRTTCPTFGHVRRLYLHWASHPAAQRSSDSAPPSSRAASRLCSALGLEHNS